MNILFSIVLVFVILFLFLTSLKWCTNHGDTITIPSVTRMSFDKAVELLEKRGFEVEIQDSVYVDSLPPLSVTKQFPEADAVVKKNRTVYLTLNSAVPPTIEMPKLTGLTFRAAEVSLRQYGLKLEDTTYRIDFAKNQVMDQLYNGESIKPGTKIRMGSGIVLVLATGASAFDFPVPDLCGLTYDEAKTLLAANHVIEGVVMPDPDVTDSPNAFVYWQSPSRHDDQGRVNRIRQGQIIDIKLSVQKPDCSRVDSAKAVMPPPGGE
jgi:eukaryotic-like serine/threonine-protein kinase